MLPAVLPYHITKKAEQYNSTQDESLSDAKKQADHLTDIFLKESAASYQEISIKEKEGNTSLLSAQYTKKNKQKGCNESKADCQFW